MICYDEERGRVVAVDLQGDDRIADIASAAVLVGPNGNIYMGDVQLHGLRLRDLRKRCTPEVEAEIRQVLEEELKKCLDLSCRDAYGCKNRAAQLHTRNRALEEAALAVEAAFVTDLDVAAVDVIRGLKIFAKGLDWFVDKDPEPE